MYQQPTSGNTMRLSTVDSMFGAPMGRKATHAIRNATLRFIVHVCPLDIQGYDEGGAYWGMRNSGQHLWRAVSEDGEAEFFFDAPTREKAAAHVIGIYPESVVINTPPTRLAEEFILGYIETALALGDDTREGHESSDLRTFPVNAETETTMRSECLAFIEAHGDLLNRAYAHPGYSAFLAGADLWCTRNGEGVGYWDKGADPADAFHVLTLAAKALDNRYIEVGDDGEVHHYPSLTSTRIQ
ncbi:hypothetical protein [Paraburkholderia sp. J8-2]|uniref:hypothetical protein n=1 Tax=Paraburkholderia sp. J8-2 TaxID=2805440 RepID=UPI002AB683BF|nr:hypothetical protein [Paraburkholderia sp. J8-2]